MTCRVVVPLSGGKDSQACLKLALQKYSPNEIRGLFCDTQFEHPLTYAHIETIKRLYGIEIDVRTGGSVLEKCLKYGRFPGGGSRHCTDYLKIQVTKKYLNELADTQGAFEVWYGMRSGESSDRKKRYSNKTHNEKYAPHEIMPGKYPKYLFAKGVEFRLPILNWTTEQVIAFVGKNELNPLYESFDRVGCFPCLASKDSNMAKAFSFDAFGKEQYVAVAKVAETIKKPIFRNKNMRLAESLSSPCMICSI